MHELAIVFPLMLPLLAAVISLFFWKRLRLQWFIYLGAMLLTLGANVWLLIMTEKQEVLSMRIGAFEAPFAITLVCDLFSALMLVVTNSLAVLLAFFAPHDRSMKRAHLKYGFFIFLLFLMFGINGGLLSGDIFNLYVWFEVMLVSSFALITLGGKREQLEGATKYVTINFMASALLLAGIGVTYGFTGSTNMAELSVMLKEGDSTSLAEIAGLFFLVSLGIKSAIFPMFFWLPASYHTPSISVTSIIAGLLTKVGVYALIRVYVIIIPFEDGFLQQLLLVLAGFTMLTGVLGAVAQYELRKLLSFHIISQIGYMIMGLAINTPLALGGAIFFIIHNIIVKSNLFFVSGLIFRQEGTTKLKKLGGHYHSSPVLAAIFFISAFSLAGIPPLSGFWGKYYLALSGMEATYFVVVGIALFTGLLTLFSMSKIWRFVFLRKRPEEDDSQAQQPAVDNRNPYGMYLSMGIFCLLILWLSFFPATVIDLSQRAAEQLFEREVYIEAVLKTGSYAQVD
jgi:multicomponent Na+:H+ antiporter subunit D